MNEPSKLARCQRNLRDAGCSEDVAQKYLALGARGERAAQYRLLARQRLALLDQLHASQRQIDCLDYLVYTMEQEDK
ncbi:MAG: hypothetical protein Q4C56_00020 [Peptococcaceae bacterium]|nr:hypothetical protein [Peptococcaceae bacterium]